MIYLDHDYKIDCENKIKYDTLTQIANSTFNSYFRETNLISTDQVYESDSEITNMRVFIVKTTHELGLAYKTEDCVYKQIAHDNSYWIYKIVIKTN